MLPTLIFTLGIILILLNFRCIKKDDKSFKKTLQREKNNNNRDYDVEIIGIRKDMAETVLELQKEIEDLKLSINSLKKRDIEVDNRNSTDNFNENKISIKEDVISSINFSNKMDNSNEVFSKSEKQNKVKNLLDKGLSDDEICEKLSIGKGEILLIRSLLRK